MGSSPPHGRIRFDFIDALRGIAILGVLFIHAGVISRQSGVLQAISMLGNRGVQLFYMVSAFTLFLSLDSAHSERHKWSNFFIRRFFRIAPLFYVAMGLKLLLRLEPKLSGLEMLSGFVFLHGLSPRAIGEVAPGAWSIADESSFYLLVPLLFFIATSLKRSIALFMVLAIAAGGISFYLASLPQFTGEVMQFYFRVSWFPIEIPVFLLGIIAYLICKQRPRWERSIDPLFVIIGSVFLFLIGIQARNWGLYLSCIPIIGLIAALSICPYPLFVNRFTMFMGKISYSMYLMHFFVLDGLMRMKIYLPPTPLGFVMAYTLILIASIPICLLTFRYIEQPGIRLGKNWIKKRETAGESQMSPADA